MPHLLADALIRDEEKIVLSKTEVPVSAAIGCSKPCRIFYKT
jgi:hypothetical protein